MGRKSNYTKNVECPICSKNYHLVEFSAVVCEYHQDWIVTTCQICGKISFSDCRSYCPECVGLDDCGRMMGAQHGYSKDHRAPLRYYGLEGWE